MFESALLLILSICRYCTSDHVHLKKTVVGSFLRVVQTCRMCRMTSVWDSQPSIGSIPAGNIILSSAILYTGSLPSKALRIFKVLNCACIDRSTFFRHQAKYLQPVVKSIWHQHQNYLLKEVGASLIVSGDGRADSPGHSAKYGTYSLVDLQRNKVVEFKLVQVGIIHIKYIRINNYAQTFILVEQ